MVCVCERKKNNTERVYLWVRKRSLSFGHRMDACVYNCINLSLVFESQVRLLTGPLLSLKSSPPSKK